MDARNLLPTDVLALVAHGNGDYDNAAWPRERLGAEESAHPLRLLLDQFVARRRSAWVSVQRQKMQGLVAARKRGGREAWEIDYMVDATDATEALPALLDAAIAGLGSRGAQKLFVRLDPTSELLPAVREAGFMPYQEEALFARETSPPPSNITLRPVTPADSYLLYRLYDGTTPEATRRSEAANFAEWHAAQERGWLRGGAQLIYERDGEVHAWAGVARLAQGVAVDLLVDETALNDAAGIVASAVRSIDAQDASIFVLLPRSAEAVARRLLDAGFGEQREFVSLMRRTTKPLELPKLTPVVAKNAVVAS